MIHPLQKAVYARFTNDVQDGSVDYYDFDWGEPVSAGKSEIPCGCSLKTCDADSNCMGCTIPFNKIAGDCIPNLPAQKDDSGYEMVDP